MVEIQPVREWQFEASAPPRWVIIRRAIFLAAPFAVSLLLWWLILVVARSLLS